MRVAYVTTYDSSDVHAWSGLGHHISRCLEMGGMLLERIGPLDQQVRAGARVRQVAARMRRLRYSLDRDPAVARAYAAQVEKRLESVPCDLIFSPGTIPIAHLSSTRPIAFWADATFAAMLRLYPDYRSLSRRAVRDGMELDNRCLARADLAFYASEWAARSAVEDHGAVAAKVEVMPFGANMVIRHDRDAVAEIVHRRPAEVCRLLWVGVDWSRKGGDRAVATAQVLNDRGLPTELHIVGCTPRRRLPQWAHVHGFIDKSTGHGADRLRELYEQAHVLLHPATAECFGVVFCEAAAYGVLSAASRVGGIPTAIREGLTGALFEPDAAPEEYADYVLQLLDDRGRYETLAVQAFDEYERTLSWEAQARRVSARFVELA